MASPQDMRFSLRLLQFGLIAVTLAVTLHRAFELDRFLVPKEVALHLCAATAGVFALRAIHRVAFTWIDGVLVAFLGLSAISAALATNPWLGLRATAMTASSILLFWIARALRDGGLDRPLLAAIAFGIVLACVTSLLQAYGVSLDLFAQSRAPGGTLGNRNFVGHAAAFGLPVVILCALRAVRFGGAALASIGVVIVTGALVLTRSRAAWLASAVAMLVFVFAFLASPELRRAWRRIGAVIALSACGLAAALLIPNTLRWRSDNPYLESMRSVASYDEGSGRGRLVQYEQSLRMAAAHPLLGAGPGNWPVRYPEHAVRNDPSLDTSEAGMTFNPWPSSDWIAFFSERGFPAGALIVIVFIGIALRAFKDEDALRATALLGVLAGACVTASFDAVLLLPLPAFFVWTSIGALWPPSQEPQRTIPSLVALLVILASMVGAARSIAQVVSMDLFTRGSLTRAVTVDPGNYRAHLRLARIGKRAERCEHARAAHALFPNAAAAKEVARRCE